MKRVGTSIDKKKYLDNVEIPDYPYAMNFYEGFPKEEIGLLEFEKLALKRYRLLKVVENAQYQNLPDNNKLNEAFNKYLPLHINKISPGTTPEILYNERREDYISHFILRLAYCQTEDLREWFIRQEAGLFKYRWDALYQDRFMDEETEFVKKLNLNMEVVSDEEKHNLKDKLMYSIISYRMNKNKRKDLEYVDKLFETQTFFKLPFESVIDLVQNRSVFIKKGMAYILSSERISVVLNEFKKQLKESLEELGKRFSKLGIDNDERLKPIIDKLSKQRIDEDYTPSNNGDIKYQDIPRLARYFPLCMEHLQEQLVINSHLRHGGRMQYGLFLKGIGLSMEESLKFWRAAFNKMTDDQFNKGYAYNIRHNYGREGKRTNYAPYSCTKIIMSNAPSVGDHHGCPFRHASLDVLAVMLRKCNIKENKVSEICVYAREHHYQLACRKMLEAVTGINSEFLENINHPNEYFDQCYPNSDYNKNKEKNTNQKDTQMDDLMDI